MNIFIMDIIDMVQTKETYVPILAYWLASIVYAFLWNKRNINIMKDAKFWGLLIIITITHIMAKWVIL